MEDKRGQIAVFIIIGLVIVIGVGVFLYMRSATAPKAEVGVPTEVAQIKIYIDECLKKTAGDAVLDVALHGGYYYLPEKFGTFPNINSDPNSISSLLQIPYYFYQGEELIPTKDEIEKQLSLYMLSNLLQCDLSDFEKKGYGIEKGKPDVTSIIGMKAINFDVNYPLTVSLQGDKQTISRFSISLDANLMKLYNISIQYVEYQKEDPTVFFISRLMDLNDEDKLMFRTLSYAPNDLMINFIDNGTIINNKPLIFGFAIKFLPANKNLTTVSILNNNR